MNHFTARRRMAVQGVRSTDIFNANNRTRFRFINTSARNCESRVGGGSMIMTLSEPTETKYDFQHKNGRENDFHFQVGTVSSNFVWNLAQSSIRWISIVNWQ